MEILKTAKNIKNNFVNIAITFFTVLVITFTIGTEILPFGSTVFMGIVILCFLQFMMVMFDGEIFAQIEIIMATPLKIKEIILIKAVCLSLLVFAEAFFYYVVCSLYFKSYILNISHLAICIGSVFFHSLFFGGILYTFLKKSKLWIIIAQTLLFMGNLVSVTLSEKLFACLLLATCLIYIIGLCIRKKDDKENIIKRSMQL